MIIDISSSLASDISRVIENPETDNLFNIECIFSSGSNPNWYWKVLHLVEFDIVQNFVQNYTDLISLSFIAEPREYIALVDASQDLWCEVKITRVKHHTEERESPIVNFTYRAIIKDKKDLRRNYPPSMLQEDVSLEEANEATFSNSIRTDVDLIDPTVYNARKRKLNFILRDATVSDAILLIAESLDITRVHFVPPDNEKVYTNLIIPPSMGISEIFNYLQTHDAFGIYNYGSRAYYTDETLFLYPLFDVNPKQSRSMHVYIVGDHMYQGLTRYDKTIDDVLHVVSNSGLDDMSLIDAGIENTSNWYICQQSDQLMDEWRTMGEESFDIINEALLSIVMNPEQAMTDKAYSPTSIMTDNVYKLYSRMAAMHLTASAFRWNFATPLSIQPGQIIVLHHDGADGYSKAKSIPISVAYALRQLPNSVQQEDVFNCTCNINTLSQLVSE